MAVTVAICHCRRAGGVVVSVTDSVTLVPLLQPRIAAVVVAVALPEALLVVIEQPQPGPPLGALPEVQVWYQQTGRTAVLGRQRPAVDLPDDPRPTVGDVGQRQVGRVAGVAEGEHERGLGERAG